MFEIEMETIRTDVREIRTGFDDFEKGYHCRISHNELLQFGNPSKPNNFLFSFRN